MKIGVLALQGDFKEHIQILKSLRQNPVEIRTTDELLDLDGLIIPGGESTTLNKLIKKYGFDKELKKLNLFMYGTCAGAIVLSKEILDYDQESLKLIDISIKRNAYGRQIDSFQTNLNILDFKEKYPGIFIRAPIVKRIGKNIKVLAKYNGTPVLLRNGNVLISTFHPELTKDTRIHKYFLDMIKYK